MLFQISLIVSIGSLKIIIMTFFYLKIRILELIKFPYVSFVEQIILVLIGVYKLDCDSENVSSKSSSTQHYSFALIFFASLSYLKFGNSNEFYLLKNLSFLTYLITKLWNLSNILRDTIGSTPYSLKSL